MRDLQIRNHTVALLRSGLSSAEVARRLAVPYGTISYWRHMDRAKRGECPGQPASVPCPRCDGRPLDESAYAYLLGLYLGDGHISRYAKHRVPSS